MSILDSSQLDTSLLCVLSEHCNSVIMLTVHINWTKKGTNSMSSERIWVNQDENFQLFEEKELEMDSGAAVLESSI